LKFVLKRVVAVDSEEREESTGTCSERPAWACLVTAETPGDFMKAPD